MKNRKRILKSEKYLAGLLAPDTHFYIGIPFEEYHKNEGVIKYNLPSTFNKDANFNIPAKGSISKANIKGKMVRKQPEEKTTRRVEIKYTRSDGAFIHYFRDFHVYVKVLQHQYNIALTFMEDEQGNGFVVSPALTFDNHALSNMKNTHVINLFLEVFGTYQVLTEDLGLAEVAFNKEYDFPLLPPGEFDDHAISAVMEDAGRYVTNEHERSALHGRLKTIQEYKPELVGRGPDGFNGYIVFGFKEKGVVLLESIHFGNATYVFAYETYEGLIGRNKQDILRNKLAKRRFFHKKNWEKRMRKFLL
ncbi:MAG TPA: hypothetical protein VI112_13260 [Bacteroidia bacterium]|jgi:hypothetical protein